MPNQTIATAIAAAMPEPIPNRWLNMAYIRPIPIPIPIPKSLYLRNVTTSPPVALNRGLPQSQNVTPVTRATPTGLDL